MTIEPSTCGPDDAYVVRLPHRGRTHIAQRINPGGAYPWRAIVEADAIAATWYADSAVTVLHGLVPKRTAGLTGKYRVERIDGKPVDWAFVLQDTDPFTPVALLAYAGACEGSYPVLARDLRQKVADLQNSAEQNDRRREIADEAADAYKAAVRAEYGRNTVDAIPFESGILAVVDTVRAAVLAEAVSDAPTDDGSPP
ncbi:hypothetical protein WKY82_20190 [Gordonia malaquae]|uniref:hypothetical protein n=1 Tax=Gordonia malaquae TaxID=410332 RepID=UPI0030C7956B